MFFHSGEHEALCMGQGQWMGSERTSTSSWSCLAFVLLVLDLPCMLLLVALGIRADVYLEFRTSWGPATLLFSVTT